MSVSESNTQTFTERLSGRFSDFALCATAIFLLEVVLKVRILMKGGLDIVSTQVPGGHLSFLQLASLFAGEFWECEVLLPLLLLGIGWLVQGWWKRILWVLVVEVELFFAFAHWATYEYIFEFPSKSLILDFFGTLKSNPDFLVAGLLTKRARIVLLVTIVWGLLSLLSVRLKLGNRFRRGLQLGFTAIMLPLPAVSGFVLMSGSVIDYYRMGPVQRMLTEMIRSEPADPALASGVALASKNPLDAYRTIIFPGGTPESISASHFSKPAVPPNVIFVVWETAGYRDYPIAPSVAQEPNLAALMPHSLIGAQHYSADVESIRSQFEIFSGLYEMPGRGWSQYFVKQLEGTMDARPLDSLPKLLGAAGYTTRYYFPASLWPERYEPEQLDKLGFQEVRLASQETLNWGDAHARSTAEKSMYQMAVRDIQRQPAGKPFMMALVGSIGHFPLSDIRAPEIIARDPNPDRKTLLKVTADFQDQLLGTLIQALRDRGMLEDTILVITGDHGPRSLGDDPDLNLAFIGERNFHVPLLIHYPRAFPQPVVTKSITSHVDLAPTVLDLMGTDRSGLLQQGLSMLDSGIDQRITYFLGEHLLSETAMHYRGKYLMVDRRTHVVYRNDHFAFSSANAVRDPEADADAKSLLGAFNAFKRVQEAWVQELRDAATSGTEASSR